MGVSTDAFLVYGVPLDEEIDLSYDEEDPEAPEKGPAYMAYTGNDEDGIEIVEHCSDECPMYFAIIKGSEIRAHRGCPKKIEEPLHWDFRADDRLKKFCKKYKLAHGEPGWYLASMWA